MDAVDLISSGKVDLVVNTPRGRGPRADGNHIRRAADGPPGARASPPPRPRSPPRPGSPSRRAARRPCGRCRSTTPTASSGSRSEVSRRAPGRPRAVDLTVTAGRRSCCPTRSSRRRGRSGYGDEVAAALPAGPARRGDGEVARRVRVARQPRAAARADGGRRDAQLGRAAGSRASSTGSSTSSRSCARSARASSRRCGVAPSTTSRSRRRCSNRRSTDLVAVEVNVSCPNLEDRRADVRALDPTSTAAVVRAVLDARPRAPGVREALAEHVRGRRRRGRRARRRRARAHAREHAARLRHRRRRTRRPQLGAGGGGLSGPPLKPVALRVRARRRARRFPGTPIIGTGGVVERRGRRRDAAGRRERGRRRHRDLPRAAGDAAHPRRARSLVPSHHGVTRRRRAHGRTAKEKETR